MVYGNETSSSASASKPGKAPNPNPTMEDYMDETIRANLPNYPCNEDIVIAGMSAKVAGCYNVSEIDEALYSGKDLLCTTEEAGRYENGLFGNQSKMGAIPDSHKFDANFFNMYPYMANSSDPSVRLLLERAYEAIIDAGESLESLKGTRTSVIVGSLPSDSPECALTLKRTNNYTYIGYVPCHMANRISFFFDLKGPSFTIDSACSSSLAALETAVNHIRLGYSDNAIIASANLVQNPYSTLSATYVGMLCSSGYCKAFDRDGDGFVRADGNLAILLRKRSQAKRVYGTVMHLRGNNDGFTKEGLSVPSAASQTKVVKNVYTDMGIDPNIVKFAECHGPGTQVGDGIEVDALAATFCTDRKDPLYVGSVKTNIAHCEGAAGLASVIKCLISLQNKKIAPNLHFKNPNPNIASLFDGRVKVATEPIPLESGIISCSSFGVGGTNYNVCLRAYKNENRPPHPASKVPRLFVYGARTKEAAAIMMEEARKNAHSVEWQALLQPSSLQATARFPYRFYDVLNSNMGVKNRGVEKQSFKTRPVWLSFSGMGTQWKGMGRTMMKLDIFRRSIERSADLLKRKYDLDLLEAICNCNEHSYDLFEMTFVGITAIQIALYDLISALGIEWDNCLGHSLGETAAAYADGSITHVEAILLAYWRGRAAREGNMPKGKMLAVGMDWEEAHEVCPKNCWPACHNYQKNVTISGLIEPADKLCEELNAKGYFAREIDTLGKAFHCPCTEPLVPIVRRELSHLIPTRKMSSKFMSTSIPQDKWHLEESKDIGVEYLLNNLIKPVLYYEVATLIPENAVVIEVSPNAIFYGTLKKTVPASVTVLSCMKGDQTDNVEYFLNQMGQAYINGVNMNTLNLYEPVQFPVPKGTPYTSPMAQKMWDHSVDYFTPHAHDDRNDMRGHECLWEPDLTSTDDVYLKSYMVKGENIYPPGGYLLMAWKTIAHLMNRTPFHKMAVVMENVSFLGNKTLNQNSETKFTCSVQTNGAFEVRHYKESLVRGLIRSADDGGDFVWPTIASKDLGQETLVWSSEDIYEVLDAHGLQMKGDFRNIIRASQDFTHTEVDWSKQWDVRMNAILQCAILQRQGVSKPGKVVAIDRVDIRPAADEVDDQTEQVTPVKIDPLTNTLVAANIVMQNVQCTTDAFPEYPSPCILSKKVFVPFQQTQPASEAFKGLASSGLNKLLEANSVEEFMNKYKTKSSKIANGELHTKAAVQNGTESSDKESVLKMVQKIFDVNTTKSKPNIISQRLSLVENLATVIDHDTVFANLDNGPILESCLDLVARNVPSSKLNIIEMDAKTSLVYPNISSMLSKNPKLTMAYTLADESDMNEEAEDLGVTFENWSLRDDIDKAPKNKYDMVVAKSAFSNMSNPDEVLSKMEEILLPRGFVLIQECMVDTPLMVALRDFQANKSSKASSSQDFGKLLHSDKTLTDSFKRKGFEVVYKRSDSVMYNTYLLRKTRSVLGDNIFVEITDPKGSWLSKLQNALTKIKDEDSRLWVYSQTLTTGMLGLLRSVQKEGGAAAANLRCVIKDGKFNPETSPDMQAILKKDLVINEVRGGVWGFESSIGFDTETDIRSIHTPDAYLSMEQPGDLQSFTFLPTPPTSSSSSNKGTKDKRDNTISVYYAVVSGRDAKTAAGGQQSKLNSQGQSWDQEDTTISFGMEFAGRGSLGEKVMGITRTRAMATEINPKDALFTMPVPTKFSMKTCAGMLTSYSTALYALRMMVRAKPGQAVLVTCGHSDVGQATISVALHYGLDVYTTVSTEACREFVTKTYPKLTRDRVCLAKDSTLVQMFLAKTKGRGMDIVLNTLTSDTPRTSLIRLVTKGGFYIDAAGPMADSTGHSDVPTLCKDRNVLELDIRHVMASPDMAEERKTLFGLLQDGVKEASIQPTWATTYSLNEVEVAFKKAASDSNIGKVLVELRQEEQGHIVKPVALQVEATPKTMCYPDLAYVIIGGLESFGLEVAQWLTLRGCSKLVLVGSTGVTHAYQRQIIEGMERRGIVVNTWTKGCRTDQEVQGLVTMATTLGSIGGILLMPQTAPVLAFKDMTQQNWQTTVNDGAYDLATTISHLDSATRGPKFGQHLHLFCVFTSLTGGWMQADGTPANFSNALVERMIAARRNDLLPGKVIQIGSVDDLSVTGNKAPNVDTTHAQTMNSLLQNLDDLLTCSHPVTSCYVLPVQKEDDGNTVEGTPVQLAIAMELGIPDFSNYDQTATLMDMGMDSIVGNQAVAMLASKFRISIDSKALTQLTVEQLAQLG